MGRNVIGALPGALSRYRDADRRLRHHLDHYGWPGAFAWLLHILTDRPISVRTNPTHCTLGLTLRIGTTDTRVYEKVFVHREYDIDMPPDDVEVIVDCGAYTGLSAIFFHEKFPHAKIYAIESDEENYKLLEGNVRDVPEIIPIHAAIWHQAGILELDRCPAEFWSRRIAALSTGQPRALADRGIQTVQAITVEGLIAEHSLPKIDILKLDVEGAEREVLANSDTWIGKVGVLVAELHDRYAPAARRLLNMQRPASRSANEWART